MKPFNLFITNHNDFRNMMDISGELIYVNGVPKRAFISNTRYLKEQNDKYISTDFEFKRGDIIFYDNRYWMVITQVGTPRHESYKGMIRQLEHDVIFNLSILADKPKKSLLKVPSIVSQTSDFVAEYSRTTEFITVTSEIHVIVQDNPKTQRIVELVNKSNATGTMDGRIIFGYRAYDITGVSATQKGVLDFTCTLSTLRAGDDRVNNIPSPVPSDWKNQIDDSMYEIQSDDNNDSDNNDSDNNDSPDNQLPDDSLTTDVSLLEYDGSSYLTFTDDSRREQFETFAGYRVIVYKNSMWSTFEKLNVEVTDSVVDIGELSQYSSDYGWYLTIEAKFEHDGKVVYLQPKEFKDTDVNAVDTSKQSDGGIW